MVRHFFGSEVLILQNFYLKVNLGSLVLEKFKPLEIKGVGKLFFFVGKIASSIFNGMITKAPGFDWPHRFSLHFGARFFF
jgi:hypothetical protein